MIKTLRNVFKQDKEKFKVPNGVQDIIPVDVVYHDGIFQHGKGKFSKMYQFSDINYYVASREDQQAMFLDYSELLNSLDSGATTKLTINNRKLNKIDFRDKILMKSRNDNLDEYRMEYNRMLIDKATGASSIVQDKYLTVSINKKTIEEARTYFTRVTADLNGHFARLGATCKELTTEQRLQIAYDFYRQGEEDAFIIDVGEHMQKGHSFKDYICPDYFENNADYIKMGDRYARVLFLKDYAAYIKDSMVSDLTSLSRNMMLSIDIVPVPTDEAVREVENRLLGVETNITNWVRLEVA